jgi:hypothetical protein
LVGLALTRQAAKAAAEQQQSRVDWVLSEVEKIEAEQEAAAGESSGSKRGSSRNREQMDDTNRPEDVFTPRVGKRRRTKKVEEMDKTDETEKMPAARSRRLQVASTVNGVPDQPSPARRSTKPTTGM